MRAHLESLFRARNLDRTLASAGRTTEDAVPTGLPEVDAALGGGLPRGQLSEIVGPASSGRTTVLVETLRSAASRGELVALIDTCDRFDPVSAAGAGLDLTKLLWIRDTGDAGRALKAMMLVLQAGGFGVVALDLADVRPPALRAFPFTTWLRLARAVEGRDTAALLLAASHLARSPGGTTLTLEPTPGRSRGRWAGRSDRDRLLKGVVLSPRTGEVRGRSGGIGENRRLGD